MQKDFFSNLSLSQNKCWLATGDRTYADSLRHLERYKPDKALEPIQLSKFPDAKKHNGYVAPIERDDWPAPPDPAAAYPELCKYSCTD